MWRIISADRPDDFVVGTGETHSVREFCEAAFAEVDFELEWEGRGDAEVGRERRSGAVRVAVDPKYFRPAEVDALQADATKARELLGWAPTVTFGELVRMMVRHDLAEVQRS
jgi:GDPmannose 4,6-dehydratase